MNKDLFVFDLDFTLWNAGDEWCDCNQPPYHKKNGYIYDSKGACIYLYPDVIKMLEALHNEGKKLAIASRTSAPSNAIQLLTLFDILSKFHYKEIFPGSKIQHMVNISRDSRIAYENIIFFDDEMRNIYDVSSIGIESVYIEDGIKYGFVKKYLH